MSFRSQAAVLALATIVIAGPACSGDLQTSRPPTMMQIIKEQVALGSRAIASEGHSREIELIEWQLRSYGLAPRRQTWSERIGEKTFEFTNIIASVRPEATKRIILGTHFDTIIRAYRDEARPDAVMPGANNGASGVAVLLELANRISLSKDLDVGIDLVFFDGEEGPLSLGGGDRNWRAIGSPFFVKSIPGLYAGKTIRSVVIFDMVCFRDALFRPEASSAVRSAADVGLFWTIAARRHPNLFLGDPLPYAIEDDHSAFMQAGLPAFLVIGFEYEPWYNTTGDTPDKCSADVLDAVVGTTIEYIERIGNE